VIIFSDLLGLQKTKYFEKLEDIDNNSNHISVVVTDTGVEGIVGLVGDRLHGEDSALTVSEFLERDNKFYKVWLIVCIKKVHIIVTNLECWLTIVLKHPGSDIRILLLKIGKMKKRIKLTVQ